MKDSAKRMKRQVTDEEEICETHKSDKVLVSRRYKELSKVISKKPNNPSVK